MLALQSYEQASVFSVLTADELYYINGGSFSFSGACQGANRGMIEGGITGLISGTAAGACAGGFGW